jgi:uncharacterized protein YjcR
METDLNKNNCAFGEFRNVHPQIIIEKIQKLESDHKAESGI